MNTIVSVIVAAILSLFGAQQPTHNAPIVSSSPALAAAAATSVEPAQPPTRHVITYTVQAGDTLTGIAQSFSIPLSNLLAVNGLSQRAILHQGEQLIIPDPQTAPATSTASTSNATSDQTTLSQNVKSALNPATPIPPTTNQSATSLLSTPEPAFDASNFITRDQFNAAMAALGSSVQQLQPRLDLVARHRRRWWRRGNQQRLDLVAKYLERPAALRGRSLDNPAVGVQRRMVRRHRNVQL